MNREVEQLNIPASYQVDRRRGLWTTVIRRELREKRQQVLSVLAKRYNLDLERELRRVEDGIFTTR